MALLSLLDHLYCQEDNLELEDERLESVLPLTEDRETERYVLLAAEAEDDEEWAEVLSSLAAKEGEALGELVPHGCGGESYLPSARKAAVEWVARAAATYAFSALTAVLAVNYLDRCFLSCAAGGGLLRLRDGKPWMGRLAAMACLSLAAKVEETRDPFLLDLQVPAPPEASVEEDEGEFVFESKTIRRMELLVLSALGWRMNPVTPLSFIHHVLPRLFSKAKNADSPATAVVVRIQTVMRRCEAALLSVIAGKGGRMLSATRGVSGRRRYRPQAQAFLFRFPLLFTPTESQRGDRILLQLREFMRLMGSVAAAILAFLSRGGSSHQETQWQPHQVLRC
ncbi:hypothetical protein B296_00009232 [Ensete ventricosum]|uniref:Cyclin-like domain-containing protein n=1 Tax=Ensete ventricosum TaxID=4639 RepID=A0A426Z5D7_ENSVE|nr:hypothetical protein B296_00009232 [Ensete ventricosum]